MKLTCAVLAVVLAGGLLAPGVGPALAADQALCPMGGTMVQIAVNKDKALDWARDQRKVKVTGENTDAWSVLALSRVNDDVAILLTPGYIFFGIAGKGKEAEERIMDRVFGNDQRRLKEVVQKAMGEFWKGDVVKIGGDEVQKIGDAAGLGTLVKDRAWELKTDSCKPFELDASDL